MSQEVPLVIYRNDEDGEKRIVLGTAIVEDDGTMVAQVTDQLFVEEVLSTGTRDVEIARQDPFGIYRS